MKKLLMVLTAVCLICLQGCDKNDAADGWGTIRYNGRVYLLKNVELRISEATGVNNDNVPYKSYYHALICNDVGPAWVVAEICTENIELTSGEFHIRLETIRNEYNAIQMSVNLDDDYVRYSYSFSPAKKKMNLTYIKKDDRVEIELKYIDSDGDFLLKWEGPVKEEWW